MPDTHRQPSSPAADAADVLIRTVRSTVTDLRQQDVAAAKKRERQQRLADLICAEYELELTMQGSFLRFYVHEGHSHHGQMVWEWLLQQAKRLGIRGGSAFRDMAGFGRHGKLHEARFFELQGSLTMEVEFIVTDDQAQQLLDLLHKEKIRLFYAQIPARFGVINPDAADPPP
jgi:PII-like signaling protein